MTRAVVSVGSDCVQQLEWSRLHVHNAMRPFNFTHHVMGVRCSYNTHPIVSAIRKQKDGQLPIHSTHHALVLTRAARCDATLYNPPRCLLTTCFGVAVFRRGVDGGGQCGGFNQWLAIMHEPYRVGERERERERELCGRAELDSRIY